MNNYSVFNFRCVRDTSTWMIIMTNIEYWVNNYSELKDWCKNNVQGKYNIKGMVVEFELESDAMLFVLRWS